MLLSSAHFGAAFGIEACHKLMIAITIEETKPVKTNYGAADGIKPGGKAKPHRFCFHLHFMQID